jgi:hypothetical protein
MPIWTTAIISAATTPFVAYCASYVLCSRYNVPKDMFRFDRLPENMSTMDARSVRNELSKIRDVANEISADMAKVLDKNRQPGTQRRSEIRRWQHG